MDPIPIANLLFLLLPVAIVGYFHWRWINKQNELLIAVVRMVLQLLLVGYALEFIFNKNTSAWGTGVVLFMMTVSSWIALRVLKKRSWKAYGEILLAVGLGGGVNLALIVFGVLNLDPWYELRFLIPIAGMVFSNGMNVLSIGMERFETERESTRSFEEARNAAFSASMIPQINSLLAVGLVALPGMMTGQILSGVSPLVAVRYQIMVMAMLLGTAGFTLVIYFLIKQQQDLATTTRE